MISDLQHHLHHKPWRGLFLGEVSNSQGGISGTMFAVDERTVYLADYTNVGGDSSEFIGSKMVFVYDGSNGRGFCLFAQIRCRNTTLSNQSSFYETISGASPLDLAIF